MPPSVSRALGTLAGLVTPTQDGFQVGTADVPSGAELPAVAEAVYTGWYLAWPGGTPSVVRERQLAPLLRAAHAGATVFQDGWVVLAVSRQSACLVGRDGEQRVVRMGDYVGLRRPGAPVAAGDEVAVNRRIDMVDASTGWWVTRSPTGDPEGPLGRLYLHPDARTVPRVVHAWTARLLAADLAWSLKCPVEPAAYRRPDTLITYIPREHASAAADLVLDLLAVAGSWLRPEVPPLTEPLGSGASYADDPGPSLSFGQHLCRALAPGVVTLAGAIERGPAGIQRLASTLAASGIDPARPWRAATIG